MATGSFSLAFNANGGSGAPSTMTVVTEWTGEYYFAYFQLPSKKPSRTYYSFQGWSKSQNATSASYAAGSSYSVVTAAPNYGETLFAVWKRNTAYVYYNANGGSGAPSTQSHNAGTSVTLSSTIPTRTGYNFKGWATSATATVKQYDAGASYNLYTTVTLYAVWESVLSTISVSNGTMGSSMSISISNYDNTKYTTTISWTFGSQSGTIVSKTTAASATWTPNISLASEIPNSKVGNVTFTVTTYSGNTAVGTTTKAVTLTVPSSTAPTCSVAYSDTNVVSAGFGLFVQSRSTLSFVISAAGQYGATISTYSASVNGATYTSATFTTGVLLNSGSNSYSVTVTDSRGYTNTVTGTFSVVAYTAPTAAVVSVERDDSTESTVNLIFDYSVASVSNNNAKNYEIKYKLRSASSYSTKTTGTLPNYSGTLTVAMTNFDIDLEYDFIVIVSDSYSSEYGAGESAGQVGTSNSLIIQSQHVGGLGFAMKSQGENRNDFKYPVFNRQGTAVNSVDVSGNYAKILTFGTNITISQNKLPPMIDGTYEGNGAKAVVVGGVATLSGTTTASGNAFNIPLSKSLVIPADSYLHCMNSVANGSLAPSLELSTDAGNTSIAPSLSPANRIYTIPSNRIGITVDRIRFYIGNGVTLSGTYSPMICLTPSVIPYTPYGGKNLAPVNTWNNGNGRRWWGSNLNSSGLMGSVLETLPAGTYTISWKHTLTAIPNDLSTELKVGKYVRVYYGGSYHILSSYSLTTIPTYAIGDTYAVQATITIDANAVGQSFEVLAYCGQNDAFYASLTEYQIEVGSTATPYEPHVDISNINVNAPITLEYAKTGDVSPVTLTINFNRDYSLNSFVKDASADAYLVNPVAATWDLYIGKNTSDKIEILDFHNTWANSDMTITWGNTSISTLPTGYVEASPLNTVTYITPNSVSVSSGSWTTVAQITFTRGIWVVSAFAQFNSNATGRRGAIFSETQNDGTAYRSMSNDNQVAVNGALTFCRFVDIYEISTSKTFYLNAYQNSGSALTTFGRIYAIKIV